VKPLKFQTEILISRYRPKFEAFPNLPKCESFRLHSLRGDGALTVFFAGRDGGPERTAEKFKRLWSIGNEIEGFAKSRNFSMNSTAQNSDGISDGKCGF
jgi:hypothetical protein